VRYRALALDYDGTLAHHGRVDPPTIAALEGFRATGRRLILVTGRVLAELLEVFPRLDLFDRIIAENGGLLYRPETSEERTLAEPPPAAFIAALEARGVEPIVVGRVIVATREPHVATLREVICALGLDRQIIGNKGAVMVLPTGVTKATGLATALPELGLVPGDVVGVGDAENDQDFLAACGLAVAVANALPALKERADHVTNASYGAGVVELIDRLIADP
jgi:hydroxymethylpyrimidine pyrophosphatase-like HAD family hydrolase